LIEVEEFIDYKGSLSMNVRSLLPLSLSLFIVFTYS